MLKKIALYGGAFDPPHISHIQLIHYLEKLDFVDQVWLLPCGDRNDKKLLLSKNSRFALMQKIFKQNKNIKVVNYEIQMSKIHGKMIHTYDLLKQLKQKFNNHKFYFVIGGDILQTIQTWGNGIKLKEQTDFIIFNRRGYQILQKNLPPKYFKCEFQLQQISSSFIKRIVLDNQISKSQKISLVEKYLPKEALQSLKDQNVL